MKLSLKGIIKFDSAGLAAEILTPEFMRTIKTKVIEAVILDMISKGISPVTGRKFEAYASQRATKGLKAEVKSWGLSKEGSKSANKAIKDVAKTKYPLSVQDKYPDKQVRPVNLYLSGKLLSFYTAWITSKKTFSMGIPETAPDEIKVIGVANNRGTDSIPARRFVPIGGESYGPTVRKAIRDCLNARLKQVLAARRR